MSHHLGNNSHASSSPSSSSASASPLDHAEKQLLFNSSNQEDNGETDHKEEESKANADESEFNEDSSNGFQENEHHGNCEDSGKSFYDNDEGELEEQNLGHMREEMEDEIDENDMRSRSPSNSSKSSGCSSMSSLIQKQFLQQKHQFPGSDANKLLMSHLAGLAGQSAAGLNPLAFESHLKLLQQQRNLLHSQQQQQVSAQQFQQPHGNYNSYNAKGVKRKKQAGKEYALNSFIPTAPTMKTENFDLNNRMVSGKFVRSVR